MISIHELGHVIATLMFKPKLEVIWYFSHTKCNWKEINNATIPNKYIRNNV